VVKLVEYLDAAGRNAYATWFDRLGARVFEYRIDYGPGYRV
jgi:hypothetical protein